MRECLYCDNCKKDMLHIDHINNAGTTYKMQCQRCGRRHPDKRGILGRCG